MSHLLGTKTPVTILDLMVNEDELAVLKGVHEDFEVVKGDMRDPVTLQKALTDDVVGIINLAGVTRTHWCAENFPDCHDVNVKAVDKVLNRFAEHGGGWFIQASEVGRVARELN